MKIAEAKEKLRPFIGVKFSELMIDHNIDNIKINKGMTGQLLEILIGSKNSPARLDFEDGELKTNNSLALGQPKESMFIMQAMSVIDELYEKKDFYKTDLYRKIDHFLYVPVCKIGRPKDWYFIDVIDVSLNDPLMREVKLQLEKDYYKVCEDAHKHTVEQGGLHTIEDVLYLQIRTKDHRDKKTSSYHPIFSKIHNKHVSNKNFAFYFKTKFMKEICRIFRNIK